VDPPRKGCEASLLATILEMAPEKIVYVSCDPATLARDIRILTEGGYELKKAVPVDMFPQTMHVETVVLLNNNFAKAKDFVQIGIDAEEYYRIMDSKKKTE
jgi:23S rRNA (uracil1939-C5)-methyltransferase